MRRTDHFRTLIATLDRTIAELEGGPKVNTKELYRGFSAEKQAEHEAWLVERYGEPMRKGSTHHASTSASWAQKKSRHARSCWRVAPSCTAGRRQRARSERAVARHRDWVVHGKPCPVAPCGLADLYESHPDFRARYELLAPGLSDYLPAVMRAYARSAST
jgi:hypothetical protein